MSEEWVWNRDEEEEVDDWPLFSNFAFVFDLFSSAISAILEMVVY